MAWETEERLRRTTADVLLAEEATARSSCCGVITLSQLASIDTKYKYKLIQNTNTKWYKIQIQIYIKSQLQITNLQSNIRNINIYWFRLQIIFTIGCLCYLQRVVPPALFGDSSPQETLTSANWFSSLLTIMTGYDIHNVIITYKTENKKDRIDVGVSPFLTGVAYPELIWAGSEW